MTEKAPHSLRASRRLAEIAFSEREWDEAGRATEVYRRLPARPGAPAPTASRPGHRHHREEADGEDP